MRDMLCAVPQVLLARYCRVEDIIVGTPLANRSQAELEGVIGYFVNVAALRADLSGMPCNVSCEPCTHWQKSVCAWSYSSVSHHITSHVM